MKPPYSRILLKISGEAFSGEEGAITPILVENLVQEITAVHALGIEIAIVLGGGNFWRQRDFQDMNIPRVASDQIGMLATLLNVMVLANILNNSEIPAHPCSAFTVESILPRYHIFEARKMLQEKKIVLLGGGTGAPFFTTDTTAALRAAELECSVVLKATKVDGIYDSDPAKNSAAQRFSEISYAEAIQKNLQVMDQTAFSLCAENKLPIIVFNALTPGNLLRVIQGESIGTRVC